jgi:hypothetical protein
MRLQKYRDKITYWTKRILKFLKRHSIPHLINIYKWYIIFFYFEPNFSRRLALVGTNRKAALFWIIRSTAIY